jgi:hypothetical protein
MRVLLMMVVVTSLTVHADWPMARRDSRRTAETADPAELRTPAVAWRRYLGGSLNPDQFLALDVDGDGSVEVVLIAGGKLVAKRPDDTVVWETPPMALSSIVQVTDLDGDGARELVVTGETAFLGLFELRTGALRWRMAGGTFGTTVGAVRIADLNADGRDDLYAADVSCGSINQSRRAMGWSFANGFGPVIDDGSRRLWELPLNREYFCGANDVVADLDGDGRVEVVAFAIRRAYVYDGATGMPLSSGQPDPGYDLGFSIPYGVMSTEVVSLPAGRRAIVAASNNSYDVSINSRSLLVMAWDRAKTPQAERFEVKWRVGVANLVTDSHAYGSRLSADFDGDGTPEVVSTFVEGGQISTRLFDVLTGAVKARFDGGSFAAVLSLRAQETPTLVLGTSAGIQGFRFTGFQSTTFPAPAFTLPAGAVVGLVDRSPRRSASLGLDWATVPVPDMAHRGVVVISGQELQSWTTDGTPRVVDRLQLPQGIGVTAAAGHRGVSGAAEGLLIARSDGYLIALDAALRPINFGDDAELPQPGIRTGGVYSGPRGLGHSPITVRFDGGYDELVVRDSLGRLLRLDSSASSLIEPPKDVWSLPGASYPVALDLDGDGRRELLVAFEGAEVVGRAGNLTERFRVRGQAGWGFSGPIAPLRRDGGWSYAVPEFNAGTGEGRITAFGPGGTAWSTAPLIVAGSGQGSLTVDDLDGDGDDDVFGMLRSELHLYRGADGTELGRAAATYSAWPVTVRGRAGAITTVAASSIHPIEGLALATPPAATTAATWTATIPATFYTALAATLDCQTGLVLANAGYQSTTLAVIDVRTGFMRGRASFAQGRRFDAEAEVTDAGLFAGSLGNVTALRQLWAGQSGVLVGSTDGFLYAIDACTPGAPLLWSMSLRSPVGEPVTGDFDGDGTYEVALTAADGFLYGIGPQRFPAPREVRELDPAQPTVTEVDESFTPNGLFAEWDAVPGAVGYEWALLTAGGTPVTRHPIVPGNPFIPLPATVTRAQYGSMLRDGARYFFAVRAVGLAGASTETLSDGVRYRPMEPDGGEPDAGLVVADGGSTTADAGSSTISTRPGCSCGTPVASMGWLVLVFAVLGARGRRRP